MTALNTLISADFLEMEERMQSDSPTYDPRTAVLAYDMSGVNAVVTLDSRYFIFCAGCADEIDRAFAIELCEEYRVDYFTITE